MIRYLALAACVSFAFGAQAGPQYIDDTGFAVSGYDVVAYFDLPQSELGEGQAQAVPGKSTITAGYNGARFAFASEENREKFLSDPTKYAPQYDGHCAYGVAVGAKVPANPHLWRIVDDKLYLNITKRVVRRWERDVDGYISDAATAWTELEVSEASTRSIPRFSSSAAPLEN